MTAVAREATIAETATLVHGFTMADVDRAAKISERKSGMKGILSFDEREQIAWSAIVEKLYACGCGNGLCRLKEQLTFIDLLHAGREAIMRLSGEELRTHGERTDTRGSMPRFRIYWLPVHSGWDDGFTEKLCERLSLRSALSVLTPSQYEVLATLAAFDGDQFAAAAALGKDISAFKTLLSTGRKRIKEVWFEGETPANLFTPGETCRAGHSRAEHGVLRPGGKMDCRTCHRNRQRLNRARER